MNISMIGAGYVGLVSAACFSEFGWTVKCVDKDPSKIENLRQGKLPIYEPRLDELLHRNLHMGRIAFSSDLAPSVGDADLVFLAVGTPMRRGDGHADLSFVFQAVEELAPHLKGFTVICTKSTVPVGTSREIERRLKALAPTPTSRFAPIPNSCAKARPSMISCIPTACLSAATTPAQRS